MGLRLRCGGQPVTRREVERGIDEVLAQTGLTGKADRLVGELSHGDQRAAEIAMALTLQPRLLLLDEPTAGMGEQETYRRRRSDPPPAPEQRLHDRADRA